MTASSQQAASKRQLLGLDLTRFAAAFMVMAFHLASGTRYADWTRWGWVGVEVFFVMSGFVIAYTAESASAGKFLRNRIVRLMPAVWLCGSITALAWALHGGLPHLATRYLATLTLWPSGPWVDGSYWTLPVEVAFYALVFGVLALGAFRRIDWLFGALCAASAAYWLARLLSTRFPGVPVPSGIAATLWLAYGCYFALGGVMWSASRHGWTIWRGLIALTALAIGALQIVFTSHNGNEPIAIPEAVWLASLGVMALSIWRASTLTRWLGPHAGIVRLLGLATYPLYLLHDDMGTMLRGALAAEMPIPVAILAVSAVFVLAAFLVAAYLEPALQRPLRAVLARLPTRGRSVVMDGAVDRAAASDG